MNAENPILINVYDEQNNKIIKMELEEAVKNITAHELPDKFNIEAVKAMSVAIRTGIVRRLKAFDGAGCEDAEGADIKTSMKGCQYLLNLNGLKAKIGYEFDSMYGLACDASSQTSGLIITCGGRPINAEYHAACGGGTENSEDIMGNRVMYLRKVLCDYCFESPYYETVVDIPISYIEDRLKVKLMNEGSMSGRPMEGIIEVIERDDTDRVKKIKIGGKVFTGNEVKDLLNLNSSRFGWNPLVIRFTTRGMGNGLGMCLYGANKMAQEGKMFSHIINYYYTNIKIENIFNRQDERPLKGRSFIIDPGHGGEEGDDEKGPTGLREKDVNLYIAQKLASYLEKVGAHVLLTRDGDQDVSLAKRVEIVNEIRPNFLISIHQNSFFSPNVSGTEIYHFKGDREGEKLGRFVLDNVVKVAGTKNKGVRAADFYILRSSRVSSIVVECMYITNPYEEQKLRNDNIKDEIAKAIYRGIMDYYGL